ncbi:Rossmann-like and DUF2520 domain-containing protein [Flavobacterium sp. UMI-01]|uniref:Rossmann-like and DUF2520 domain-containing protein n=1 Tax=Flavobacterium sp. UMI-01 TaxID=1441053 RepID=UPI001C7DB1A0|nr:DUF2520 domain-containing protein [Flavobacterium sp. UMI-01]GIZ07713.1 hypothetical protein FUMI01_04400 [Flavobacterium sp. UMI-01]
MIKVVLIGSGNLAQHLIVAFQEAYQFNKNVVLVQAFARKKETLTHLLDSNKIVSDWEQITQADLYILAVSDDAIHEVSTQLPYSNCLVVHTSGAMPMTILNSKNRKGVFYPLQSFSKDKEISFSSIPICLEAEHQDDFLMIEKVAQALSGITYAIASQQRKALHVAAVFVNNFTNHLYQLGAEICEENQIPFAILHPLIQETAQKITTLKPELAQTGPAIRNDQKTIDAHEEFLKNNPQLNLYKILTQSIQNHGKKL